MADELWDMSLVVERMAVAMWSHEAFRAQRYSTSGNRDLENFRKESKELQNRWIGFAAAALDACFDNTLRGF